MKSWEKPVRKVISLIQCKGRSPQCKVKANTSGPTARQTCRVQGTISTTIPWAHARDSNATVRKWLKQIRRVQRQWQLNSFNGLRGNAFSKTSLICRPLNLYWYTLFHNLLQDKPCWKISQSRALCGEYSHCNYHWVWAEEALGRMLASKGSPRGFLCLISSRQVGC